MAFLDEAGLRTLWGRTTSKIATIKSEIVSYTGTGSAGVANPTSVTFSKAPGAVIMLGYTSGVGGRWHHISEPDGDFRYMLPTSVFPTEYTRGFGFGTENLNDLYGKKSADGKTFSWYSNGTAEEQCNYSGYEYYVLALFTDTFALDNSAGSGGTTGGGDDSGNAGGDSETITDTITATVEEYGNITVTAGATWLEYIAGDGSGSGFYIDNDNCVRLDDWYVNSDGETAVSSDEIVQGIYYLSEEMEGGE